MKYIFIILICFLGINVYSQPLTPRTNGLATPVDSNLFVGKAFRVPVFRDTTQANTYTTLDSSGKMIFTRTGNTLWVRTVQKGWISIATSSNSGWQLTGNSITSGQFFGTTNNQPLDIRAFNKTIILIDGQNIIATIGDKDGIANGTTFTVNDRDGDDGDSKGRYEFNHRTFQIGTPEYIFPQTLGTVNSVLAIGSKTGNRAYLSWQPSGDTTFTGVAYLIIDSASHSICTVFTDSTRTCSPLPSNISVTDSSICFPSGDTSICYTLNNYVVVTGGGIDSVTVNGSVLCWYPSITPGVPTCITINNSGGVADIRVNGDSSEYDAFDVGNNILFSFPTLLKNLYAGAGIAIRDTTIDGVDYVAVYNTGGAGSGWGLTGNAGTNPTDNFIGTTDIDTLAIRVGNTISGKITPTNLWVGVGSDINNNTVENVLFGGNGMGNITTGNRNTGIGHNTYQQVTTGNDNVAIGDLAGYGITTGNRNIAIGSNALFGSLSVGQDGSEKNIAIGVNSLKVIGVSSGIVSIGDSSGYNIVNGVGNVYLGNQSTGADAIENASAVGANSYVGQSNTLTLGSVNGINGASSNVNVGISTTTPTRTLQLGEAGNTTTFLQYLGTNGNDAVWYDNGQDANVLRLNSDDYRVLINEGNNTNYKTIIGNTGGDYPFTVRQTGSNVGGYGTIQAGIQKDDTEVGIQLDNLGTGGRNYNFFSTNDGSGIGGGKFSINDATAAAARLTINSSGNVGIGTTTPTENLDVTGNIKISGFLKQSQQIADLGAGDVTINSPITVITTATTNSLIFPDPATLHGVTIQIFNKTNDNATINAAFLPYDGGATVSVIRDKGAIQCTSISEDGSTWIWQIISQN